MKSPTKVNVVWSEEKMGHLPSGATYSTIAKFAENAETWPSEAWSVVLDFAPASALNRSFEATARFLMPNAPWDRFKSGCVFELYEGNKRTATVTVL
jgi:hypothetical protein